MLGPWEIIYSHNLSTKDECSSCQCQPGPDERSSASCMLQRPAVGDRLKFFKRNKPFPCLKKYLWNPHSDRQLPEVSESCMEFRTHSRMGHVSLSGMAVWESIIISQNTYPCNKRWFNDSEAFFKSSWALLESLTCRRNSGEVVILCLAQSFLLPWSPVLWSWTSKPSICWKPSAPLSLG